MDALAWIALASLWFTMMAAIIGVAVKGTWWLGSKLAAMETLLRGLIDAHEEKDRGRHSDNLGRLDGIEGKLAIIARNGKRRH